MGRQLPPFAAIKAYEAVARHLSVKEAAKELCLSPSAVSHQIRALEEYFDTALFERVGSRLQLTLTGRSYAGKMTALLDAFDESTRSVRDAGALHPFRILCTPSFAARWLVPRLSRLRFGDRVRLRIADGLPSTDFATNDADVVIQWADDPIVGVATEPLMISSRFPVVAPALREREDIRAPKDLCRTPLIHFEAMDGWSDWFLAAGIEAPAFPRGPIFSHCELATTAAERELGVALALEATVRSTLAEGRLVRLFDTVLMPHVIYSVAYAEARRDDPGIREFSDWVHDEVAREGLAPRDGESGFAGDPRNPFRVGDSLKD